MIALMLIVHDKTDYDATNHRVNSKRLAGKIFASVKHQLKFAAAIRVIDFNRCRNATLGIRHDIENELPLRYAGELKQLAANFEICAPSRMPCITFHVFCFVDI